MSSVPIRTSLSKNLSHLRGNNSTTADESPIRQLIQDDPNIIELELLKISKSKQIKRKFQININKRTMKWKSNSQFQFQNVQSLRYLNRDTLNYQTQFNLFSPYWITIIYYNYNKSPSLKIMHLIASSKRQFDYLVSLISKLIDLSKGGVNHLNEIINDPDSFKTIDLTQLTQLLNDLNLFVNPNHLAYLFNEYNKQLLTFNDFRDLINKLKVKNDLKQILVRLDIKEKKESLNYNQFTRFINDIQKLNISDIELKDLFNKYKKVESSDEISLMSLNDYLLNANPFKDVITSDYFDHPLNEYFISSSHNTYLLGKQIYGKSSIEGYVMALQRGCRCLEIDIWESDSMPIVTHGRTLTNSIEFKSVVQTIKKYAFWNTSLPLIISLEIKCSIKVQLKCIDIMKNIFNSLLVLVPVADDLKLPTPNELRNRILLKVKKSNLTEILDDPSAVSMKISSSSSSSSSSPSSSVSSPSHFAAAASSNVSLTSSSSLSTPSDTSDESSSSFSSIKNNLKSQVMISPELTNLAPYLVGVRFRNFSLPESKTFNHIFSFGDRKIIKLIDNDEKLKSVLKHNKFHLMRLYPSIIRYRSNNFNPSFFWDLGIQMVATNWQIWDIGQEINESLFKGINNNGFFLKPRSMRSNERNKNLIMNNFLKNKRKEIKVKIISANQLLKPLNHLTIDPYCEIEFFNLLPLTYEINSKENLKLKSLDLNNTSDYNPSASFQTNVVENNGFNPLWNSELKLNYLTNSNSMGFIRISVKSQKTTIGSCCFRIENINDGFVYLKLYDSLGKEYLYSTLLIEMGT